MLSWNKICRCFRYDILYGFSNKWKNYLLLFIMITLSCIRFKMLYAGIDSFSIGDYFIWNFKGMPVYTDLKREFIIPDGFFAFFHLFLLYTVGFHTEQELKNNSHILLIHANQRLNWWIGKCFWVIANVAAYYLTACLSILLFGLCSGAEPTLMVYGEAQCKLFGIPQEQLSGTWITLHILLMCLISMGSCLLQAAISIIFSSVTGFVLIAGILSFSIFIYSRILWGNYFMLLRMPPFETGDRVGLNFGFLYGIILCVISIILGYIEMKHKDIYSR